MTFVKKVISALQSSQAVKQSVLLTVGSSLTSAISAVALIYISRVLGPHDFGIFSVGTAFMMIAARVGDMGLSTIITRQLPRLHNDTKKATEFLGQIVQWKILLSVIGVSLIALFSPKLQEILNFPYPVLLTLALIGSVGLIIYEYVLLVMAALHLFTWVNIMGISQASFKVVTFFALGLFGLASATSVSVFYYAAPFIAAFMTILAFPKWFYIKPATASEQIKKEIKKYFFHAAIGMLAVTLIGNVDVLFVQKYLSTFETGIYSAAVRISLVVSFFSAGIGGVLNNRVARYQSRELQLSYLKKSLAVVLLAIVGFFTFLPLARYILIFSIGEQFISGLMPMIVLVFNAFLALAVIPYISFFYAVDHPKYFSYGGVLQVVIICAGNLLFLSQYGLIAASFSRVAATAAHFIFTLVYIRYAIAKSKRAST
jgi:O-antigen/teichoic acid export membrane protein